MLSYHFHEIKVKVGNIIQMENAPVACRRGKIGRFLFNTPCNRGARTVEEMIRIAMVKTTKRRKILISIVLARKDTVTEKKIELCEIGPRQFFGVHEALSNSQSGVKVIAVQFDTLDDGCKCLPTSVAQRAARDFSRRRARS